MDDDNRPPRYVFTCTGGPAPTSKQVANGIVADGLEPLVRCEALDEMRHHARALAGLIEREIEYLAPFAPFDRMEDLDARIGKNGVWIFMAYLLGGGEMRDKPIDVTQFYKALCAARESLATVNEFLPTTANERPDEIVDEIMRAGESGISRAEAADALGIPNTATLDKRRGRRAQRKAG